MNLHHLKTFYLTAKHSSVSQAARVMNIAQPAATRHLKELQNEIDIILFNNRGKKLYLTNEGKILYEKTKKLFKEESEIEVVINEIKRFRQGLLSVSSQATFADYYFHEVLLDFYNKCPDIALTVSTFLSDDEIHNSIEKMDYDLGITSVKPKSPVLKSKKIFTAHQYLIVPPGHRLANEELIKPDMLKDEVFILPEKSTRSRKLIDNYFRNYGIKTDVLYELGHTIPIVNVVKNNVGVSVTYRKTVLNAVARGDICMIPMDDPKKLLSRDFYLIYNREKYISEIIQKFLDTVDSWSEKVN
jgi:DNA-binding transcriptional LysR family regulator